MRIYVLLIALLSLLLNHGLWAQLFESINDQFPFARPNCIYQDNYGFMWFGTRDGLVKYDGYSVIQYRKIPGDSTSLPGSGVLSVIQYSDSILLVGMQIHGLVSLNRKSGECRVIHLPGVQDIINVTCFVNDQSGLTWIGTDRGLFTYQRSGQAIVRPDLSVTELFVDERGQVWIGTTQGLCKVDNNTRDLIGPGDHAGFPLSPITDIGEDRSGRIWLSVEGGEYRMFAWDESKEGFIPDSRFRRDGLFEFAFDIDNNLWISSHTEGIYYYTQDTVIFYSPDDYMVHGMRSLFTRSIEADRFGNIWIQADDVYKVAGSRKDFRHIISDGFQAISVYADDEYIWYCAREPMRWSRQTGLSEAIMTGIEFTELRDPSRDKRLKRAYHFEKWNDKMVFSTIRNVFVWDPVTDEFTEYPTDVFGAIRDFTIDGNDRAWLTGGDGMPVIMDLNNGAYEQYKPLEAIPISVAVDRCDDGLLWWGDEQNGLFVFNPVSGMLKNYAPNDRPDESITSFSVNDVLCHSSGDIWVGTKFGLNRVDGESGEVGRYQFEASVINTYIASLLEDNTGALWLGTQEGIVYFNSETDSVRQFTNNDGLANTILTPRACHKDDRGWLYFAGDKGIDYFDPSEIGRNLIPPVVLVKSIRINGTKPSQYLGGETMREITLEYDQNSIEIEMLGLQLVSPSGNICSYRLPLQSPEWYDLGKNRVINLVNLAPGEYVLEGKCANADGIWSSPVTLLIISVNPPYWLTSWFLMLMAFLIVAIGFAIYFMRVRKVRKTEQLKTEYNKRIAELEMKALRAQMNPHFLFNSLNSVKLMIDKGKGNEAKHYLTRYGLLIRLILANSRKKFIRIDEELEMLKLYLELEKMRFKNFTYEIVADDDIETDFLEIPPMLLQPYVENALWHGLMNKQKGDRHLKIQITRTHDVVKVIVEDNGVGRRQAAIISADNKSNKESLGLKISEERLDYLKELYGNEAAVQITDLQNDSGTRVIIQLPAPE